ncbi:MAG: hypothetical protein L0H84_11605, partial [Pseudonocardia sp.]|nr:hypothetical protein [Pseudonocardia sp.]
MSWLFGQTWIWYLIAFAVGVLVAWLLFVRPAQRRLNTLRAAGGGPTGDAAADDKTSVLDRGKLGAVAAGTATAGAAGAALAAARGGSGADAEADEATGATVDDAPTEQIPAVDPALATLDTSSIGMVSPTEATTEIPVVEPEVDAPTSVLSTAGADATEADADGEASVDSNGHGGAGAAAALGAAGLGAAGLAAGGSEDESEATAVSSDTSEDATTAIPHTAVTAEASGDVASVSEVVAEEGTDSDATTALGV